LDVARWRDDFDAPQTERLIREAAAAAANAGVRGTPTFVFRGRQLSLDALDGAAIAGYLTWVHYRPGALVCVGGGGCEPVQRSRWAEVGPVPVAVLGLA